MLCLTDDDIQETVEVETGIPSTDALSKSRNKKKKKKGSDSTEAASKRDPLMIEFAAVFQALEASSPILLY